MHFCQQQWTRRERGREVEGKERERVGKGRQEKRGREGTNDVPRGEKKVNE